MGLTTYYPHQSRFSDPYSYTVEITGSSWASDENYMMSTVSDVTMLNSYRGIGIGTMRDERGRPPTVGQTHESATVRNVKGTALLEGVQAYTGADVGTWENITLSNGYWANAPAAYNPPQQARDGFVLGDLEWDQFYGLSAVDYPVGIHVVKGQRVDFTGSLQRGADPPHRHRFARRPVRLAMGAAPGFRFVHWTGRRDGGVHRRGLHLQGRGR
jgi:hypothetical protein